MVAEISTLKNLLVFDIETMHVHDDVSARRLECDKYVGMVYDNAYRKLGVLKIGYKFLESLDDTPTTEICNIENFAEVWNKADYIVGYNLEFDCRVLEWYGFNAINKGVIDLYHLLIKSLYGNSYVRALVGGRKLDQVAKANGYDGKAGNILSLLVDYHTGVAGAMEAIIKYLKIDIEITYNLLMKVIKEGGLTDPKTAKRVSILH